MKMLQKEPVSFINDKIVREIIRRENPTNRIGDLNILSLERAIRAMPMVDSANVYLKLNGQLNLDIIQRIPIFRLSKNDKYFYVDEKGVEFPIHLDIPVSSADTNGVKSVQSLKQSIEANLGSDNVVIDIQQMTDDDLNNITYFATSASQEDWDLNNNLGWSPDYNDPSSYLEITGSKTGENVDGYFGFDPGTDNAAAKEAGFEEYDKLLEDAAAENEDINKRYEKYAAAQAWLTDSALLMPAWSSGATPSVRKVVPFSGPFAWTGNKGEYSFKYVEIQDKPITTKEYEKAREKWAKEKEESNKKAQKELAEHIK